MKLLNNMRDLDSPEYNIAYAVVLHNSGYTLYVKFKSGESRSFYFESINKLVRFKSELNNLTKLDSIELTEVDKLKLLKAITKCTQK